MSIIAATFLSIWNRDFSSPSILLFRGRGKDEENQTRLSQFSVLSFSQEIPHPVHLSSFFYFFFLVEVYLSCNDWFLFLFSCIFLPIPSDVLFLHKKEKRKKVSFVIDWTSPWVCFGEIDGQLLIIQSCIEVGQWVPGEVTAEVIMLEFFQYNIQAWKRENSFLVSEHFTFVR